MRRFFNKTKKLLKNRRIINRGTKNHGIKKGGMESRSKSRKKLLENHGINTRDVNDVETNTINTREVNDVETNTINTREVNDVEINTIIMKTPEKRWISKNIAFRESTGTSNVIQCTPDNYKGPKNKKKRPYHTISTQGLWVPTLGLANSEIIQKGIYDRLSVKVGKNFITKLEFIMRNKTSPIMAFIKLPDYSNFLKRFSPKTEVEIDFINVFGYNDSLTPINTWNRCLFTSLDHYFTSWWQLQMSAKIGGNYWTQKENEDNEQNEELKNFILKYEYQNGVFGFRDSTIDDFVVPEAINIREDGFNGYLENNDALPPLMLSETDEELKSKINVFIGGEFSKKKHTKKKVKK
jgi:hypothetical protein